MKNLLLIVAITSFSHNSFPQKDWYTYPDTLDRKKLNKTLAYESGSYLAGLSFLSFIWYKDHKKVPFHFYNDAKGYLQMDKAGHAYAAYYESYVMYHALRNAGVSKGKALLYGGPTGLIFQTPIEIFDGLYEGWGFSWTDMAANTFGSALFTAQEVIFDDQIVKMKFSYSPSPYRKYHTTLGDNHVESFFLDYNAHTYWLSGNLKKITGIHTLPNWLNISFGYSANGMFYEFRNPTYYQGQPFPHFDRYRQYLFSLDLDFSKIKTNERWLRTLFTALNLIKIPFPALEYSHINGIRFRPLYF